MDSETFANVTCGLGRGLNRRGALGGMVAAALAIVAGGAMHEAEATRRRHKRKHHKQKKHFKKPGQFCQRNSECNGKKHYICEVAFNASNSDKTCCGATGAVCGPPDGNGDLTAPFCCAGFDCIGGACQSVPQA